MKKIVLGACLVASLFICGHADVSVVLGEDKLVDSNMFGSIPRPPQV